MFEAQEIHNPDFINASIVVKYGKIENDIKFVEYINKIENKYKCTNSIIGTMIGTMIDINSSYLIMDGMVGDLSNIHYKKQHKYLHKYNKIHIFVNVMENILCLYDIQCYYTDIKDINILYSYDDKGNVKIRLGDLGGIKCNPRLNNKREQEMECTYRPPDNKNAICESIEKIEQLLTWGCGILYLSLSGYNVENFVKFWIKSTKQDYKVKCIEKAVKYINSLEMPQYVKESLIQSLSYNGDNRIKLRELYDVFKKYMTDDFSAKTQVGGHLIKQKKMYNTYKDIKYRYLRLKHMIQ